jgi:hypothetical protein
MARQARYTGTHAPGTTRTTLRTLALDLALWVGVLALSATVLSLDWTAF